MKKGIFVHSGNAPTDSGWANLRKDCDFAVVKCGSCAPDEAMERNLAGAKKHGFKTSILWYIDGRCDAKEQAITALATVKDVDPTAILWVDFERNGIYTPTYAQLKEFFGVFTAKSPRLLGIYTNLDTWGDLAKNSTEFSAHPLWIAWWRSENNPPKPTELFGGWKDWVIWQQADGKEGYPYTTEFCQDWYAQPTTQDIEADFIDIKAEIERIKAEIIPLADRIDALLAVLRGTQ
jgi:GH25 family lysozyme M1 (1,4-beta-N-acetylmuramidase)